MQKEKIENKNIEKKKEIVVTPEKKDANKNNKKLGIEKKDIVESSKIEEKKAVEKKLEENKSEENDKKSKDIKESDNKKSKKIKESDDKKNSEKKVEKSKTDNDKTAKHKENKVKKTTAFVNVSSIPISTKHSIAVCRFIKGKEIEKAVEDLEKVILLKKAIPMKGEIPHRKGMMSGRYPKKAAEHFIRLLKGLLANTNVNGLETPIISESIANLASRPYGKFGRVRKKRTHIKIIAIEKVRRTK